MLKSKIPALKIAILLLTILLIFSTIANAKEIVIQSEGTTKLTIGNGSSISTFENGDVNITQTLYVGNLSVQGIISATTLIGNGSQLTGIQASRWNVSGNSMYPGNLGYNIGIGTSNPLTTLDVNGSTIIRGDLNVSGTNNIFGNTNLQGNITVGDGALAKKASMFDDGTNFVINTSNVLRVTNNILADKNVSAQYFIGNGAYLTNVQASSIVSGTYAINISGNAATATNAGYASTAGSAATVTDGVYTTGSYNNPNWIIGLAASKVSGLTDSHLHDWNNVTSKPANLDLDQTNDLTNITNFAGDISGTYTSLQLGSDVVGSSELNDSATYTMLGLIVNGNINLTQNITAQYFIGDGSKLSGITTGSVASTFFNKTSATYSGSFSAGGYTGYNAGDYLCDQQFAGSHLCSFSEIHYTIATKNLSTIDGWSGEAWIATGPAKFTPADTPVNDCNGFTHGTSGSYLGNWWTFDTTTGGVGKTGHCGNALRLGCCK